MKKTINALYFLLYFLISLIYMEIMFRILTTGEVFSIGLIFSFIFSISIATLFYVIISFFEDKVSYILSSSLLGLSALIFSSQLIYYKFFRTYYSLYSAGKATQVLEFSKDIWSLAIDNFTWLFLLFLPAILIIAFKNKIVSLEKINRSYRLVLISVIVLAHTVGVSSLYIGERTQYSAYDLYFNSSYPVFSQERLGLITTMRLDFQRLVSGWSPNLEAATIYEPDTTKAESLFNSSTSYIPDPSHDEFLSNKPIKNEIKVIEYNTLDIDFDKLISNEDNEVLKGMHKYFKNVEPTKKNKYTGKYKGYNLILITAEGFSPYAVRKDVTPTLYKMVNEGYKFTDFYNPLWGVSTSDGEYVANVGLIPKSGVWSFYKSGDNYLPFVMGNQLSKLGYKTVAYHNHTYKYYRRDISHPNMGYDYKGLGNGLKVKKTWPESDLEMMEKTIDEYINNEPFHAYYMTVSGHMQYSFSGNAMSLKNRKYVKDLPYSDQAKAYISCQIELDKALEYLLNKLEESGVADKTLIALSADHYPYGLEFSTIDELAGHPVERNFELYKSTFILYTKDMKPVTIDKPVSSLDIIPTISNLLGLKYDSRLLMGRDIFSDSQPLVVFLNKSFITDIGRYNTRTREFITKEGTEVDKDYINHISSIVNNKFYYSTKILETDYYNKILND